MYDSSKGDGKESMTEDTWNATSSETRVLTVQINYKCKDVPQTYNPGDLIIEIDNLGKLYPTNSTNTTVAEITSISADPQPSSSKDFDWSYRYDSNCQKYIFTNNKTINADANFEGTIQLAYEFKASYLLNNSDLEIKAKLNDVLESNTLKVKFTSTERAGSISKYSNKINSYDGLPENAEDYIWVKYSFSASTYNSGKGVRGSIYDYYFEETLPSDDCILLDENLEEIEKDGNIYKLPYTVYNYSDNYCSTSNTRYYYIGYPKSKYQNKKIQSNTNWYGKYYESLNYKGEDKEERSLLAEKKEEIDLSEFEFSFSGTLYYLNNDYVSEYYNQSYNKIINSNYGENIKYEINATSIYKGEKYTAKIGDDFLCITGKEGNYRQLEENEYYFKEVYVPSSFRNGNDVALTKKYDMQLYVKYKDSDSYIEYEEPFQTGSSKTFEFNSSEEKVVGWYLEIKDLEETLKIPSSFYTTVYIQTNNVDLAETGAIYNFGFFQIFINNKLDYSIGETQYGSVAKQVGLPEHDKSIYGNYILRSNAVTNYGVDKIDLEIYNTLENTKQDNQYFYSNVKVYNEFSFYGTNTDKFNGYKIYNLFPEGVEINCTEEEIIESLTVSSHYSQIKKQDGSNFTSSEEYKEFIKQHTEVHIDNNYKNTGKTCVEIIVNYEDAPLNIYSMLHDRYDCDYFTIPIKINYESYLNNEKTYILNSYIMFLNDEEIYLPYYKYMDSNDIDNDGKTDDFYVDYDTILINNTL